MTPNENLLPDPEGGGVELQAVSRPGSVWPGRGPGSAHGMMMRTPAPGGRKLGTEHGLGAHRQNPDQAQELTSPRRRSVKAAPGRRLGHDPIASAGTYILGTATCRGASGTCREPAATYISVSATCSGHSATYIFVPATPLSAAATCREPPATCISLSGTCSGASGTSRQRAPPPLTSPRAPGIFTLGRRLHAPGVLHG